MFDFPVFDGIEESDVKKLLTEFNALTLTFRKDATVLSNVSNTDSFFIIQEGKANIVRYNFNGTKTIMEKMEKGDIFGAFSGTIEDDLYVIAAEDSKIIVFEYKRLINRSGKNVEAHNKLIDNVLNKLADKLSYFNERIEILTEKTIRDKLLKYFGYLSKKQITKSIIIPFTLSDLSDYLAVDRSAMMREIKNLNEDGLIASKGRYINLKY
ncbi:MAG: Crp/Fnr family transcriptional regulator [Bacilli bacterium]|nr:Crp/Fnr family transcriptional regulator [Bacilli bacterium]